MAAMRDDQGDLVSLSAGKDFANIMSLPKTHEVTFPDSATQACARQFKFTVAMQLVKIDYVTDSCVLDGAHNCSLPNRRIWDISGALLESPHQTLSDKRIQYFKKPA